jgi:hypothetical protein
LNNNLSHSFFPFPKLFRRNFVPDKFK